MDARSLVQQSSSGTAIFSENSTFGQSGGSGFGSNTLLFQSTGFSAVAGTSNQSSSLFGSGGATNQSNLFGQSSVTGLSGSVFGNTGGSSNQQSGMTGSTATGQSGLFGTNFSQSAAGNTGLFGVKPELKTGLFGSASSTASSGVFGSEPQLQNNVGTISSNNTSNSSLVSLSGYFISWKELSCYLTFSPRGTNGYRRQRTWRNAFMEGGEGVI